MQSEHTFSSAHVHRSEGSKRCKFSYVASGWKNLACSGSSNTEGCVAIAFGSTFWRRRHSEVRDGGSTSTRNGAGSEGGSFAALLLYTLRSDGDVVFFSSVSEFDPMTSFSRSDMIFHSALLSAICDWRDVVLPTRNPVAGNSRAMIEPSTLYYA